MISKILIGVGTFLALALAIFAVVVALQPSDYLLERSTTIDAPAEKVFAQVNDFKAWDKWTPWKKEDPNPKETKMSNPSFGKGASFYWNGNDKIGEGTMTIVESKPHERVDLEQEFKRPMVDKCLMSFILEPDGGKTKLTWKMFGENNFTEKAVCLFMDLEKMLGPKFEQGLAAIKDAAEAANEPAPEPAVNP
jgi:uncharacterized protein YndB with AHSA1/START domain